MPDIAVTITLLLSKLAYALLVNEQNEIFNFGADALDATLTRRDDGQSLKRKIAKCQVEVIKNLSTFSEFQSSHINHDAVAAEVTATLKAGFSFESLAINHDTPDRLPIIWGENRTGALSQLDTDDKAYHDRLLIEIAKALISLLPEMPGFQNWVMAFIVRVSKQQNQDHRVLYSLINKDLIEDIDFELRYRKALIPFLNHVELFIDRPEVTDAARRQLLTVAYVTLELVKGRSLASSEEIRADQLMDSLDAEASKARLLVVGPAGCGKTTLLRWIAIQAAEAVYPTTPNKRQLRADSASKTDLVEAIPVRDADFSANWRQKVPFLIRLGGLANGALPTPDRFIEATELALHAPSGWVARVLDTGRGLILLDGIDELSPERRNSAIQWIRQIHKLYNSDNIIIASTRPAAIQENTLKDVGFIEYGVRELSSVGKREFIMRWHEAVRKQLGDQIDRVADLGDRQSRLLAEIDEMSHVAALAENPLLCALLCALNLLYYSLPQNLYDLCSSACQMLLWDRDRMYGIDAKAAPEVYVTAKFETRLLAVRDVAYQIVVAEETSATVKSVVETIHSSLRLKEGEDRDDATQFLKGLIERSGLLRNVRIDEVEFVHNALRDYLASLSFVRRGEYNFLSRKVRPRSLARWEPVIMCAAATRENDDFPSNLVSAILSFPPSKEQDAQLRRLCAVRASARAVVPLSANLRVQIEEIQGTFLPVNSVIKATTLAELGDSAIDYLSWVDGRSVPVAIECIRGLQRIGGKRGTEQVRVYLQHDKRPEILPGIIDSFKADDLSKIVDVLLINSVLDVVIGFDASGISKNTGRNRYVPLIRDLAVLRGLPHLKRINLAGSRVEDVSPLAAIHSLEWLNLNETRVVDIEPLAGLENLTHLYLSLTPVRDLSVLRDAKNLTMLDITDTRVNDLNQFASFPSLKWLVISIYNFKQFQIDEFHKSRQRLSFSPVAIMEEY